MFSDGSYLVHARYRTKKEAKADKQAHAKEIVGKKYFDLTTKSYSGRIRTPEDAERSEVVAYHPPAWGRKPS